MPPDFLVAIFQYLHGPFNNKSPSPEVQVSFQASTVGVVKADRVVRLLNQLEGGAGVRIREWVALIVQRGQTWTQRLQNSEDQMSLSDGSPIQTQLFSPADNVNVAGFCRTHGCSSQFHPLLLNPRHAEVGKPGQALFFSSSDALP